VVAISDRVIGDLVASPRTLYLARHGETEWNRIGRWQGATDIPLSEVGRAQARLLADRLRDSRITQVYASQLSRALETGQIVAACLGAPAPTVDPRLRERGYGAFEGLTREGCAEQFPGVWEQYLADRRVVPPGAEPQAQVTERITAAMLEIGAAAHSRPDSEAILVVSHGGAIRSFVHATTGVVPAPLENGAVFILHFDRGAFVRAELAPL
jgi:broad specificity phosphatase PhoE